MPCSHPPLPLFPEMCGEHEGGQAAKPVPSHRKKAETQFLSVPFGPLPLSPCPSLPNADARWIDWCICHQNRKEKQKKPNERPRHYPHPKRWGKYSSLKLVKEGILSRYYNETLTGPPATLYIRRRCRPLSVDRFLPPLVQQQLFHLALLGPFGAVTNSA